MTRLLSITLACLLVICSVLALFKRAFPNNQSLERLVRRTWIYKDDDLVRYGRAELDKTGAEALANSMDYSAKGLVRDSGSPYRWRDMGKALAHSGSIDKAILCYRRSVDLGPNNPTTLVRAATFFNSINQPLDALPYYSRALQLVSSWDTNIFDVYGQMKINVLDIFNLGIGMHPRSAEAYIHYLLAHHYPQKNIQATWNWVDSHSLANDLLAADYVDFLLKNRLYENAATVWARHLGNRKGTYLGSNYLVNGDFEFDFTGAILDWRVTQIEGASVQRDPTVSHSGKYSLMIQFNGQKNLAYNDISQTVIVNPGKYRFDAYVKTKELSTDQGVGFRIFDAQSPARINVRVGNFTKTNDWVHVATSLTVPEDTHLLAIQAVRDSSMKFDNQISGTAWIDSVALTPER